MSVLLDGIKVDSPSPGMSPGVSNNFSITPKPVSQPIPVKKASPPKLSPASPVTTISTSAPSYPAVLGRGSPQPQKGKIPPPVPPRGCPRKSDSALVKGKFSFKGVRGVVVDDTDEMYQITLFRLTPSPVLYQDAKDECFLNRTNFGRSTLKISKLTSARMSVHGISKFSPLKRRAGSDHKVFVGEHSAGTYNK